MWVSDPFPFFLAYSTTVVDEKTDLHISSCQQRYSRLILLGGIPSSIAKDHSRNTLRPAGRPRMAQATRRISAEKYLRTGRDSSQRMNKWTEWMERKGSTAPWVEQNCEWEEFLREASAFNAWLICRGEDEAEVGVMEVEKVLEEAMLVLLVLVVVVWKWKEERLVVMFVRVEERKVCREVDGKGGISSFWDWELWRKWTIDIVCLLRTNRSLCRSSLLGIVANGLNKNRYCWKPIRAIVE
jgi:hypothetical protein